MLYNPVVLAKVSRSSIWSQLGPGLLYAGAAIGVSHLVQSTRAGGDFGYTLIWAVILANVLKYPFFRMGPRYTAITGKNILHGYKAQGWWASASYAFVTISTMFVVMAAIVVVTSGIAGNIFGLDLPLWSITSVLILICLGVLWSGDYKLLDRAIKYIVVALAISTVIAFFTSVLSAPTEEVNMWPPFEFSNSSHVFFLIALMGWMPAPMDISVWHSIWVEEKQKSQKEPSKSGGLDFNIGYIGTAILALCFVGLGASVFHAAGESLASGGVAFAGQLIDMYESALGRWAYPIIAIAALSTMFSTSLTCFDAFPRSLAVLYGLYGNVQRRGYQLSLVLLAVGSFVVIFFFLESMHKLVDFATVVSFITAPILAAINWRATLRAEREAKIKVGLVERNMRILGMLFLAGFMTYFLYTLYIQ